jgi:hypothetical protein
VWQSRQCGQHEHSYVGHGGPRRSDTSICPRSSGERSAEGEDQRGCTSRAIRADEHSREGQGCLQGRLAERCLRGRLHSPPLPPVWSDLVQGVPISPPQGWELSIPFSGCGGSVPLRTTLVIPHHTDHLPLPLPSHSITNKQGPHAQVTTSNTGMHDCSSMLQLTLHTDRRPKTDAYRTARIASRHHALVWTRVPAQPHAWSWPHPSAAPEPTSTCLSMTSPLVRRLYVSIFSPYADSWYTRTRRSNPS